MSALTQTLAERMQAQGMNQKMLAEASGLSRSAISQYCSGALEPTSKTLQRLAEALQCAVADLTGEEPQKPPIDLGQRTYSIKEAAALIGISQPALWALLKQNRVSEWGAAAQMPSGKWVPLIFAKKLNEKLGIDTGKEVTTLETGSTAPTPV